MNGNSTPVASDQRYCHRRLGKLVGKHLRSDHRRPIATHTRAAFDAIRPTVEERAAPLVFDSFCGTGMSTALLALRHPHCLVIGIDKSAHRLNKHQTTGTAKMAHRRRWITSARLVGSADRGWMEVVIGPSPGLLG